MSAVNIEYISHNAIIIGHPLVPVQTKLLRIYLCPFAANVRVQQHRTRVSNCDKYICFLDCCNCSQRRYRFVNIYPMNDITAPVSDNTSSTLSVEMGKIDWIAIVGEMPFSSIKPETISGIWYLRFD